MGKKNMRSGGFETTNKEIEVKGKLMPAKCNVEIKRVNLTGDYEVTLSPTDDAEYIGASTTNAFESLATEIKNKFLPKVRNSKITWLEKMVFQSDAYKDFIHEVELDWSWFKKSYSNFKPQRVTEWV